VQLNSHLHKVVWQRSLSQGSVATDCRSLKCCSKFLFFDVISVLLYRMSEFNKFDNNNRISVAPYFIRAGGRSDQCSVKA